jgi:hypothetical protein
MAKWAVAQKDLLEAQIDMARANQPSNLSVAFSPEHKKGYAACLSHLKPRESK